MSRHSVAHPSHSPLASIETVLRQTWKTIAAPAVADPVLEVLEAEQSRIRASARHWLIG